MLVWHGPQFAAFRFPHPDELPDVDSGLARMIRVLGDEPPAPALATIADPAERDALFLSLATTLTKAAYHRQRFEQVVAILAERRLQVGGTVSSDTCSQYPIFEASALLVAARTVVDEVLYIAARRSGAAPNDADGWAVNTAITCNLVNVPKYNVDEVHRLRAHSAWYEEMNEYRNVLVHRGWREQTGGFFPIGSTLPEAADPTRNVLLMPDRASLVRVHRGHQWTYTNGTRLERVVERAADGLEVFLGDVATGSWGGSIPAPGTAPNDMLPNIFVQVPYAGLVVAGTIYAPIFTDENRAREFHRTAYQNAPQLDLFEVLPTTLNDGTSQPEPGFWLSVPSGKGIAEPLATAGLAHDGELVIALDPTLGADGKIVASELARLEIAKLLASGDVGVLVKVLAARVASVNRLLLWRRRS
jgi:hypothetical protein